MKTLRQADITVGIFLALLGAATAIAATGIKGVAGETLDPRTLPTIIGWVLVALGLGIVSIGWRYVGEPKLIAWPSRSGRNRLIATGIFFVVYLALLDNLGFPLGSALFVASLTWYLGRYRVWLCLLGGLLTGLVIYFAFMELLGLNFPMGILDLLY